MYRYFIVKPIINGFEATLVMCAKDEDSLKHYVEKMLPQSICFEISEDDFNVFTLSGFKAYVCPAAPNSTQNIKDNSTPVSADQTVE